MEVFWGLCAALAIAIPAWRVRALDAPGAVAASIVGTTIFVCGGLQPSLALIGFFISGSLLSALPEKKEMPSGDERLGRSWKQVAANGLVPAIATIISRLAPEISWLAIPAYYGAIAASASDSWATEIGTRYGKTVRDLLTGKRIEAGVSGGVSVAGIWVSIAGAAFIAVIAILPFTSSSHETHCVSPAILFLAITVAGVAAALVDSILGSAMQGKYQCAVCGTSVETPEHCSRPAKLISGYRFISNNTVNLVASAIGSLIIVVFLDLHY